MRNDPRPHAVRRRPAQAVLLALTGLVALVALFALGYISRVKARALSPDGRVEAVCRGWLPEPTEYGVWLRQGRQPWGTHLAQSGSESITDPCNMIRANHGRAVLEKHLNDFGGSVNADDRLSGGRCLPTVASICMMIRWSTGAPFSIA